MKKYTILCSIFLLQAAYVTGQTNKQQQKKEKTDQVQDKNTQQQKSKTNQAQDKSRQQQQNENDKTGSIDSQKGDLSSRLQTYDNFDGVKMVYYAAKTGTFDSLAMNPVKSVMSKEKGTYNDKMDQDNRSQDNMNQSRNNMGQGVSGNVTASGKCGKYTRNANIKYDYLKMNIRGKVADVNSFATYTGTPPKMKMKVYTTAPVGTLIEVQLGKRSNTAYPGGTNSQYQAFTTVTNAWEELEFKFSQTPQGSETSTTEIDQVTLLFNPNSNTSDTYYIDDIMGPALSEGTVSVD